MALDLNSVTRVSGAGCNHFEIDWNVEGNNRVFVIDKNKADSLFDEIPAKLGLPSGFSPSEALLAGIIYYYLKKGYSLAQLPAKCQLPD